MPLVVSFARRFKSRLAANHSRDNYASFGSGLLPVMWMIDLTGDSACIQVNFTPLGAYRFGCPRFLRMVTPPTTLPTGDRGAAAPAEDTTDWNARLTAGLCPERLRRGLAVSQPVANIACFSFCRGNVRIATIAGRLRSRASVAALPGRDRLATQGASSHAALQPPAYLATHDGT